MSGALPPPSILSRTLPAFVLALSMVAVPVLILEPEGLPRLRALQTELDAVKADDGELYRDVERLRVEVQELRENPAAVERIARDELGMIRRDEVVFQFGKPEH